MIRLTNVSKRNNVSLSLQKHFIYLVFHITNYICYKIKLHYIEQKQWGVLHRQIMGSIYVAYEGTNDMQKKAME